MRQMMVALVACASLCGMVFVAADELQPGSNAESSDRVQVMLFLKKHVIGKTVATPKTTYKWDGNRLEGDYEDQTTFNNFTETAKGFSFDATSVTKETQYDLDKNGKRISPGRDFSGTSVSRYELCERASTKKLTGTARVTSMTVKAPSQEGIVTLVTGMKVLNGKLSWNETLPGYFDRIASKGKYRPGSFDSKCIYSVVEGKLRTEYDQINFDVDPDTMKRTPAKEKMPSLVAKEIDQKR